MDKECVQQKLERYKNVVCVFSYELAMLSMAAEHAQKGYLTDAGIVVSAMQNADRMRTAYLEARKGVGLSEKGAFVAFTEDHFFTDFRLRNGRLEGCLASVERIAGKWNIRHLPTQEEAIRYEVGVYCLMHAGGAQAVFTILKAEEEMPVPEPKKKGLRKVTSGIRNLVSGKKKKLRKSA
ncbi:MAG: hypothetical protein IJ733_08280 [Lachnospiraceae bacterium]|nr:hypothetical protein [Lachnospiraceae bacterium]